MRLTLVQLIGWAGLAAASERLLQHNPVHPSKAAHADKCHSPMLFRGKYTLGRASLGCGIHETHRSCAYNEMDPFEFAYEMCEQGDGVCPQAIQLAVQVQAQLDGEKAMHAAKAKQVSGDKTHCYTHKHDHARFDPERAAAAVKEAADKDAAAKQVHADPQE
ncbi:uncharacterized protein J7T54_000130 [Emericellopsis cladophorae]|uniref:Uncharacterized protein n=1 Tax=Emericellopsis cladophorae TaxID=2686198 RepID=A0A9P9XZ06_9HYPO|nr:uncharacterized protein J7T54_000130 [Emericellopsis cladophorae]KAI6780491.1 hypothetical protein J7T54_000130 [Emericellopsis cladophorae]